MHFIFYCTLPWLALMSSGTSLTAKLNGNHLLCETEECLERVKLIKASLNKTAKPCEDFYSYTCGGWIENHHIPPGLKGFGVYEELRENLSRQIEDLLRNMNSVADGKKVLNNVMLMHKKCLESRDHPGGLARILNKYGFSNWPLNVTENGGKGCNLNNSFCDAGVSVLFDLSLIPDSGNSWNYMIKLHYKAIQIDTGERLENYKRFLKEILSSVISTYNESFLQNFADRIYEAEKLLVHLSDTRSDYSRHGSARVSISELQKNFSNIPILQLLNKEFLKVNITLNESEEVVVDSLYYYDHLNKFLSNASDADLALLYNFEPINDLYLILEYESTKVRERYQISEGRAKKTERDWDECYSLLRKNMPQVIDYIYINATSNPDVRSEASNMAQSIRDTFNATLESAEWISNQSRIILQQKLNDMVIGIGYLDDILDNTYLDQLYEYVPTFTNETSLIEMLYFCKQNKYWKQLAQLGKPSHNEMWLKGAADVGTFYAPLENRVEIPWAMLQAPFFQLGLPRSLNYGALGVAMAHEILHAFDASAMTKKIIVPNNIELDPNTKALFENKTKCFLSQYKNMSKPLLKELDDTFVDSEESMDGKNYFQKMIRLLRRSLYGVKYEKTLDDDIVDNGALKTSFMSYLEVLNEDCDEMDTRLKGLDGFSGKQLFFIGWGMSYCRNVNTEGLIHQLKRDHHSPDKHRVNLALKNFKYFAEAFSCSEGSYMNPKDSERCTLW